MSGRKFGDKGGVSNDGRILTSLKWVIPSSTPVRTDWYLLPSRVLEFSNAHFEI